MFDIKKTDNSGKIPVTVITGFLGSGKTTLLNRILKENDGRKFSVIMNEYGEVGIDGHLLYQSEEQLVEFNNGCLCCTVRQDLINLLDDMSNKFSAEGILIETTGLADPAPVASTFFITPSIRDKYYIDCFITVVDAVNIGESLDKNNEALEQVTFADVIILNKADLVTEEELGKAEDRLKGLNPLAKIIKTSMCEVDTTKLLGTNAFNVETKLEVDPTFLDDAAHEHDQSVSSMVIRLTDPIDMNYFQSFMSTVLMEKGQDLYRTKGIFHAKGVKNKVIYQSVRMLNTVQYEDEWTEDDGMLSEYVIIGKDLDREFFETNIRKFARPPKQRAV